MTVFSLENVSARNEKKLSPIKRKGKRTMEGSLFPYLRRRLYQHGDSYAHNENTILFT